MHHAHGWSPLRVLTPHFQIESLLSRPLDERAMVPRSGIEPNFLRTSKARERTSATGIKMAPGAGIEPATNELQRIAAKPLEPGIKLVLLGENRTAVIRVQNGFPATERQEHWGERRESNPHRPGHSGTCRPLHHEHHEMDLRRRVERRYLVLQTSIWTAWFAQDGTEGED